jgi:hypothetical protein
VERREPIKQSYSNLLFYNTVILGLITKNDAKSDKRDARTLAQLLRADARLLSPIKHRAEKLQTDLTVIRMRDNLIETRTRLVTSVRGVVKATGGRLPSGETSSVSVRGNHLFW